MQNANRDVKIHRSKDVANVFCFGSDNWSLSHATLDRIQGLETKTMRRIFRFEQEEDEMCLDSLHKSSKDRKETVDKDEIAIAVRSDCRKHVESRGMCDQML